MNVGNFYPRPPQGGRLGGLTQCRDSINFYPRPPQGGRPPLPTGQGVYCCIFLSTPSARRATQIDTQQTGHLFHFYPRPPQGGRLYKLSHVLSRRQFLSTPSARRATWRLLLYMGKVCNFYPRPPRGGRRPGRRPSGFRTLISIHALREEGDVC